MYIYRAPITIKTRAPNSKQLAVTMKCQKLDGRNKISVMFSKFVRRAPDVGRQWVPCNRAGKAEGTFTELGAFRRGTTNFGAEHAAERSAGCDGVAGSTIVRRYSGHVPTTIPYISMTSLYCTGHRIGSQWSWISSTYVGWNGRLIVIPLLTD